jgi:hypothetical protein
MGYKGKREWGFKDNVQVLISATRYTGASVSKEENELVASCGEGQGAWQ